MNRMARDRHCLLNQDLGPSVSGLSLTPFVFCSGPHHTPRKGGLTPLESPHGDSQRRPRRDDGPEVASSSPDSAPLTSEPCQIQRGGTSAAWRLKVGVGPLVAPEPHGTMPSSALNLLPYLCYRVHRRGTLFSQAHVHKALSVGFLYLALSFCQLVVRLVETCVQCGLIHSQLWPQRLEFNWPLAGH